jgi:hypothetical protein
MTIVQSKLVLDTSTLLQQHSNVIQMIYTKRFDHSLFTLMINYSNADEVANSYINKKVTRYRF